MSKFYISLHSAVYANNPNDYNEVTYVGGHKPLAFTLTDKTEPDDVYDVAKKLGDEYAAKNPDASFTVSLSSLRNEPSYQVYQMIDKLALTWIKNVPPIPTIV